MPALEAIDEIFDRQIYIDDLVGALQDRVRHSLAHDHAGRLFDHLVEAFEMLHVEGANHVDAGFEQFQDILIALLVAAKRRVGVRKLIDDGDLRPALEHGVEIHLLDKHAAVIDALARHDFESLDQAPRYRLDRAAR